MQVDQKSSKFSGELGSLSKADGSSKFTINDTVQLCAVYGPGEVKIVKEMAERAYVNVVYKPRVGASTNREKVMEYTLKSILDGIILTHLHPRTAINIVFQEIQNDSNYLACALNSACLALLDAGVPLKYTFGAVCCSVIENADRVVFFPSLKQEKDAIVSATFLFDSCEKELLAVHTSGTFDREQFNNLLNNAKQYVIENIFPLYNSLIKEKYHKNLN